MSITVVFAPETGISADQFSVAWNAAPEHDAIGPAVAFEAGAKTYLDPASTALLVGIATGIAVNVFSTALSDFLKQQFGKPQPPPGTTINVVAPQGFAVRQIAQADGSTLLVVSPQE